MLNVIYTEFVKLKKSFMLFIILSGAAFLPIFMFVGSLSDSFGKSEHEIQWKAYVTMPQMAMFLLLSLVLFSVVTAYIFSREFTDRTASVLYSYPVSRVSIFFGKLLSVYVIIIVFYTVHFLLVFAGGILLKGELPPLTFYINHLVVNFYSMLLQLLLVPAYVLMANISRNVIVPIAITSLGAVSNMLIVNSDYFQYSPFVVPTIPLLKMMGQQVDFNVVAIIAAVTFMGGLIGSIWHFVKADFSC